jgi:Na+-driven multidrug efflux pump
LKVGVPLVGTQLAMFLPFAICVIFISSLDDKIALGSFGLFTTMINAFFNGFFFGIQEVLGSYASRGFGEKNFQMMGKAFYQVKSIFYF